ncbi:MAG: histidinol dehydrogenase [Fuerstiella sp.]|nr:histidinol dehydrogenase [Fuerstiella sp.]MCP4512259.1 histidinol dehydrogenase [Fuerstiella sp.]
MTVTPFNITFIDCRQGGAEDLFRELRNKLSPRGDVVSEAGRQRTIELFGEALSPLDVVQRICEDVRTTGVDAVLDYTARLDGKQLTPETIRVQPEEFEAATDAVSSGFLQTVRQIRDNVAEFQSAVLPADAVVTRSVNDGTVELRQRHLPMKRVGICVPGGAAAYPSTVLMTAVPAITAGVPEIAVVVPPTEFGGYNNDMLATCHEIGITEVYRVGGAQAVAALAYGVDRITRVDKIVGPGNLFVALAKQYVFGDVDIDSIAGPSEVIVLADASAKAEFIAADLISQAEHSPGSGVLITWHEPLIAEVRGALDRQLAELQRGDLARQSLVDYGALILAGDESEAAELTDMLAPEHLHISMADPESMLSRIQNAGAIFMGHYTPVAIGDYVAGPSHVLPTGGTARFANGLASTDFMKRSSVICYDRQSLAGDADVVRLMAEKEGLTAHSASVDVRLRDS